MNRHSHLTARATAFGFAAVVTLSILTSIDTLATQPVAEAQMARQAAQHPVVATALECPSNT